MNYHPNFFDGGEAHRADCKARLELIREHFDGGTVIDVGCSEGYNTFGLADMARHIAAVDNVEENISLCKRLASEHKVANVEFFHADFMECLNEPDAQVDCVLYLSVHHHIAGKMGMNAASDVLKLLSEHCDTMLFDMGQKDERGCEGYSWWKALPDVAGSQEEWLRDYLVNNTVFDKVGLIGSFPIHGTRRLLWKLERT